MTCDYFADTCAVAEQDHEIAGFVTGFITPNDPRTLFIWQIAVAETVRGKGLATSLVDFVLKQEVCSHVTQLEMTISPSNKSSLSLFQKITKNYNGVLNVNGKNYAPELFPGKSHEAEIGYRLSLKK